MQRRLGNTHAAGDKFRIAHQLERILKSRKDPVSKHRDLPQRSTAINDGEFIAAQPRDEFIRSRDLLQTMRHFLQKLVTRLMTDTVIDVLEMIDIEIKQCEGF